MSSLTPTTPVELVLRCDDDAGECADDSTFCPRCGNPELRIRVRVGGTDADFDKFCQGSFDQSRYDQILVLLDALSAKQTGALYASACTTLTASALDHAQDRFAAKDFECAFRLSSGVSETFATNTKARNLAKKAKKSLITDLIDQANTFHQNGDWEKLTERCNQVQRLDPDNTVAGGLLDAARDLHAGILTERAQQRLNAREYDSAVQLAQEALCIIPGYSAAAVVISKVRNHKSSDLLGQAHAALARGACDDALARCHQVQTEYAEKADACSQLRHDICAAYITRSETALAANELQNARAFAQKVLDVEVANPDAARLRAEADAKIHLQDLATRALKAYRSSDVTGCRAACNAFVSNLRQTGIHVEFTDAGKVIDFATLPDKLSAEIETARAQMAFARRVFFVWRFLKIATAVAAIALVIFGTVHWQKRQFEKRVRAFDDAMLTRSYGAANFIAPKISSKYRPAADLLAYYRARISLETVLTGANTGFLQQYGDAKWVELRAQKQTAEANVGSATTGIEAYQRATALLAECKALADAGEKVRQEKEAHVAAEQLRERVRKDLDYVDASGGKPKQRLGSFDEQARAAWKIAAERGMPEGQVLLGWSYALGVGVPQDDDKAFSLYRSAAEKGLTAAEYKFGLMYEVGRGVPQDYAVAASWFQKAAIQGYALAQGDLGYMFYYGKGVPQDFAEAARWCRKAAEQGVPESQYSLGQMYWNGESVPQSSVEAARWFRKAADQGLPRAQTVLGNMYRDGDGLPKDTGLALVWFRKAADQGWADAQNNIGAMYAAGNGVPASQTEAIKWLRLAARQGHKLAQQNLRQGNTDW